MNNPSSGRRPDNGQNPAPEAGAGSAPKDTRRPSRLNGIRRQEQLPLDFQASSPEAPRFIPGGERGRTKVCQSDNYWSSTTNADNTDNAWNVNFNNGNVNNDNKDNPNYVRPVRAGESPGRRPLDQEGIFSLENIYRAYRQCRKKKRNTVNALKFEINQEEKLLDLQRKLLNRSYRPGRSILFAATKPKLREIFAADFEDRVVHHILVSELEKVWEPRFIYDSYACRKDKGLHRAVIRAQKFVRQAGANGTRPAYYLKLDIRNFFNTLDKEVLYGIISRKLKNPELLWLLKVILDHDCTQNYLLQDRKGILAGVPAHKSLFAQPPSKGLPIGNLTSQFFANVYLDRLDQYVKRVLKCRHYLRYADDFVLFSRDREQLEAWREKIKIFLAENLRLALHPRKTGPVSVSSGLDFLGYVIFRDHILIRRRVINNFKQRLKWFEARSRNYDLLQQLYACLNSYLGHFGWANSRRLSKSLWSKYPYLDIYFTFALAEPADADLSFMNRPLLRRKYHPPRLDLDLPLAA